MSTLLRGRDNWGYYSPLPHTWNCSNTLRTHTAKWNWVKCWMIAFSFDVYFTYVIHDCGPSLHTDTLKHCEHSQPEVVEIRDSVIRADPILLTHLSILFWAPITLFSTRMWRLEGYFICKIYHFAYFYSWHIYTCICCFNLQLNITKKSSKSVTSPSFCFF